MNKPRKSEDNHFRAFAKSLEREIAKYGESRSKELYERQRKQMETLLGLEDTFRLTLIDHPWGRNVYKAFIKLICEEKGNILTARPFFRERVTDFTKFISPALKAGDHEALYDYHFNYQFIRFCMDNKKWHATRCGGRMVALAKAIEKLRTEIVEINMPLAINRARLFFSRARKSQLTYMDFVQIGTEGLIAGIDKYVPPPGGYTNVFRSVMIGRMTGNFIDEHSATSIHFFPQDKKKIYRANKSMGRNQDVGGDFERLAELVNEQARNSAERTESGEIANLLSAASCVSADTAVNVDPDGPDSTIDRFAASEDLRPDNQMEEEEARVSMNEAIGHLTVLEQKLLRLRGVSVSGFVI